MKTLVRPYHWYRDFWFQFQIVTDKSIQRFMFDDKRRVLGYFLPWKYEAKYVCLLEHNGVKRKIAMAKFSQNHDKTYSIAGFVPTKIQNRGYGIYSGVAFINHFFNYYPNAIIRSGSFAFNTRAFKTTKCMGFELKAQDENHFDSTLTSEQFDNEFVRTIKSRAGI